VGEKSARKPSTSDSDGNKVSPSAVTAPLMPTMMTATSATIQPATSPPRPRSRTGSPPDAHQAANASAASSRNVLTRWMAIVHARPIESLSAVRPSNTSHAPTSASRMIKTPERTSALRTGLPGAKSRHPQTIRTPTRTRLKPEVTRWLNSMMVSSCGARGITSPLQSGQWLPQPAPEPVARTNAPHRITRMLYASTNHANTAKRLLAIQWPPAGHLIGRPAMLIQPSSGMHGTLRACRARRTSRTFPLRDAHRA